MEMAEDGDVIIYMDSAIEVINTLNPIVNLCLNKKKSSFLILGESSKKDYRNSIWCKKDTYFVLNYTNMSDFNQLTASVQLYVKNEENMSFLKEFLHYCTIPLAIADSSHCGILSKEKNDFKDHRHNQSILSILAEKNSIFRIRDCSQYGLTDKDDFMFPQIINHHRQKISNIGPKISVITPTIGNLHLERCIESVQNQNLPNIEHIIVIDGPKYYVDASKIIDKFKHKKNIHVFKLPYNVGANGWNGHKVYGAIPHFACGDLISYLDDDNWLEPNHYLNMINKFAENNKVDVVHCLRNIYDQNGTKLITQDNCESLGTFCHTVLNKDEFFIDTSCYLMKRNVAILAAPLWNKPFRPKNTTEPDRDVANFILKNFNCVGVPQYSINYPVANTEKSVQSNFFIEGNKVMKKYLNLTDDFFLGIKNNKINGIVKKNIKKVIKFNFSLVNP